MGDQGLFGAQAQAYPGQDPGDLFLEGLSVVLRACHHQAPVVGLCRDPGNAYSSLGSPGQGSKQLPGVGIILQPGQLPLQQIGSVSISEVNSVVRWLAQFTAQYRLPQKLLVLHQFKIGEIQNEQQLDTSIGNVAVVPDMDGQGAPAVKQQTWDAITSPPRRASRSAGRTSSSRTSQC